MSKPLHLVIFGRQGAGKGTQSAMIVDEFGVVHVSTGDMLRAAIAAETDMGLAVKAILDRGDLVDDQTMIGLVEERLAQSDIVENGVLLDGFPRTVEQAEALVALLGDDRAIDTAINVDVSIDEVTERMLARGRDDDTPEAIAQRLDLYQAQTVPVIEWLTERGTLVTVDGLGTEDEVFARVQAALTSNTADHTDTVGKVVADAPGE